jgi:hypothetical protein
VLCLADGTAEGVEEDGEAEEEEAEAEEGDEADSVVEVAEGDEAFERKRAWGARIEVEDANRVTGSARSEDNGREETTALRTAAAESRLAAATDADMLNAEMKTGSK